MLRSSTLRQARAPPPLSRGPQVHRGTRGGAAQIDAVQR